MLTEILRQGLQATLTMAIDAEVADWIDSYADPKNADIQFIDGINHREAAPRRTPNHSFSRL